MVARVKEARIAQIMVKGHWTMVNDDDVMVRTPAILDIVDDGVWPWLGWRLGYGAKKGHRVDLRSLKSGH